MFLNRRSRCHIGSRTTTAGTFSRDGRYLQPINSYYTMQRNNSDTNKYKNKPKLSPIVITKTISHKAQDVTSPSGTSDNDQEWNIVDNNKRIWSPNNNTSPHPKTPNEPSNFSSPNRYFLLDTNTDNMDLEGTERADLKSGGAG
ncbi:hypothetical protein QTP88_013069 [Uroleucon formosanum]